MYNAVIWGCGETYASHYNDICRQIEAGKMNIVGITGANTIFESIDSFPFLPKASLPDVPFDFVILAVKQSAQEAVIEEAHLLGIERSRIIRAEVFSIPGFDLDDYMILRNGGVSIISENCFGGILYHYLDLPFISPTINLFLEPQDFIRFCCNLPHYLEQDPVMKRTEYSGGLGRNYPVMRLDDIEIHANHYNTAEEFLPKWQSRKELIRKDNIIVVMRAETPDLLEEFENIPYDKFCFSSFRSDLADTYYLPLEEKRELWEMLNGSGMGRYPVFNVFDLLVRHKLKMRCTFSS